MSNTKPKGRRRYDPNVKRCRADAIEYKTVTDPDGTTRTVKLSRGRFVSCEKQWRAEARPRGLLGQFLPGPLTERADVEVVVSPTWVAPEDRKRYLQKMPFTLLIGRVPESPAAPPVPAPPATPRPPRQRPPSATPAPVPAVPPPPARPRVGRRAHDDLDEPTLPPARASRRPSTSRTNDRDRAQAMRDQALRGEVPVGRANDLIQRVNARWGLGISPLIGRVPPRAGRRACGHHGACGQAACGRRDPMPARLEEWTPLPTGGWVWTSAEGPSFEVVPSPTLEGVWLFGWFDLPEWAQAVVPRDVRREHLSPISAVREARDLYSIFRQQPEYPR